VTARSTSVDHADCEPSLSTVCAVTVSLKSALLSSGGVTVRGFVLSKPFIVTLPPAAVYSVPS